MTPTVSVFDSWIRGTFAQLNTELEEVYFAQEDKTALVEAGHPLKQQLVEEGRVLIADLLKEGNTDEGFDSGFDLLGSVGMYMAACRRHEITEPSREKTSPLVEASALALQLGASLGVTPRFATSHLTTHNFARNGIYKSFTTLADEYLFLDYNMRGVLAYKRAADALLRILPLGISHPVTFDLLSVANAALQDVIAYNDTLHARLDTTRFFNCVRPYYKPHRVGQHVYRGANAGDFAGINVIDLLLGLCRADNASYSQLLVDKFLYMLPEDQIQLRDCMRRESLLNQFIAALEEHSSAAWLQTNGRLFLEVCTTHGATAAQHHDQLVRKFIEQPSAGLAVEDLNTLTASGPPLPVLLRSLEKLRDLRLAADRDDIPSRHADLQRLRAALVE